jgi:AAA+ ATPase superfamily predicted ATPase
MINDEGFSQLVDEIITKGYDEATAAKFAAIIGDTPMIDENDNIVVMENEKELARLKLDFFRNKS